VLDFGCVEFGLGIGVLFVEEVFVDGGEWWCVEVVEVKDEFFVECVVVV